MKPVLGLGAFVAIGVGIWFALSSAEQPASTEHATSTPEAYPCNGDGFICPDGTMIGRTGPSCEFPACPDPHRTHAEVVTFLGGSVTAMNITVNPRVIVSDSRCAEGVQCVWAGTVQVRTAISSQVAHGEHVLELGKPQIFGDYSVRLIEVTPYPKANKTIPESSYRFTFEITKRAASAL